MMSGLTLIRDPLEMQRKAESARASGKRICVVPTMGALHEGHLSLIRIGRTHADTLITTIFVNPTQFAEGEDFERYPRPLTQDVAHAREAGTDILFLPERDAIYPPSFATSVAVEGLTEVLEGKSRPGHFRGVTTIVTKLFHLTKPHFAVFGQKDAQQVAVIRRMVADLNFDVEIIVGPTVRETDGLALSSRNAYLSPDERRAAPVLFQSLKRAETLIAAGERSHDAIVREMQRHIEQNCAGIIDYVSVADCETLRETAEIAPGQSVLVSLAVTFGRTRLIDNTLIRV
jgi:pantoate--beta-alanine ligase